MTAPDLERAIGAATVAIILGVSKRTVLRWVNNGDIPVIGTAAGAYLFDRDAIVAFRDARIDDLQAEVGS